MSPNASHRVRPGLSSAASLITTLLISFDQEGLNQHLNLVTPEYPFFESPCRMAQLNKVLGEPLLMSQAFVDVLPGRSEPLGVGAHAVDGFEESGPLYR